MKANLYSVILFFFLACLSPSNAQMTTVITESYYGGYDYQFSSRINRFHRSYSAFSYYAPVFTDVYWYNYQPLSWGVTIYGGGVGFGYSDYYYQSFGNSFYWGYAPVYSWYKPFPEYLYTGYFGNTYYGNHYRNINVYNTYNTYYAEPVRSNRTFYQSSPGAGRSTAVTRTYTESRRPTQESTRERVNSSSRRDSNDNTGGNTDNGNSDNNGNNGNIGNNGNNSNNGNNGNNNNSNNNSNGNNGNNGNRYWDDNNRNDNTGNRYGNNNNPGTNNGNRGDNNSTGNKGMSDATRPGGSTPSRTMSTPSERTGRNVIQGNTRSQATRSSTGTTRGGSTSASESGRSSSSSSEKSTRSAPSSTRRR